MYQSVRENPTAVSPAPQVEGPPLPAPLGEPPRTVAGGRFARKGPTTLSAEPA